MVVPTDRARRAVKSSFFAGMQLREEGKNAKRIESQSPLSIILKVRYEALKF